MTFVPNQIVGQYEILAVIEKPRTGVTYKVRNRATGGFELLRALPGRPLWRHAWPLGDAIGTKLALIRLYASQFIEPPQSIGRFTPASDATLPPHEAVWTAEPGGPA